LEGLRVIGNWGSGKDGEWERALRSISARIEGEIGKGITYRRKKKVMAQNQKERASKRGTPGGRKMGLHIKGENGRFG